MKALAPARRRLRRREEQIKAAKYRLAQADEALLRICRLCVSIRMHCQGMTVDEATRFFQDNCYYEQKTARQEAIRGAYDPEYLYYTLGKLEILKLREDYRKQEGAKLHPAEVPQRDAAPRRAAHPAAARGDVEGQETLGTGPLMAACQSRGTAWIHSVIKAGAVLERPAEVPAKRRYTYEQLVAEMPETNQP